jgi:hypothetical protein
MWDYLINILSHAYSQVAIFFLFAWYFYAHRKDPRLQVSRVGLIRMLVLALIFLYFLLSWSSGIRPALAQTAVLGMFLINLLLFFNLVLTRLEGPYRDALEGFARDPEKQEHLDQVWQRGKRLYYLRFFLSGLLSGTAPGRFLHSIASERVRQDVHETLSQHGLAREYITLKALLAFLNVQLAQDEFLPKEYKELMTQVISPWSQHAWIEEKVNKFLTTAMETPEDLYHPQWAQMWEKARQIA